MIDFLGRKYICMAVSFVILSLGLAAYVSKGFRYHVDFAGGLCLSISFKNPVDTGDLREKMVLVGLKDAAIQKKGKGNHSFIIQITQESSVDAEGNNIGDSIFQKIKSLFPENEITLDSTDWVGPEVGKDIKSNAFISVFLSLLLILLYVMVRSKYNYAIGAVVALAHDMLVVLAVFLILGEQISVHVLAAILTVLGYSINDTIVIFSRIKENLKKMTSVPLEEVVNISINQTLRRTLLTSLSTFLAVGSIFLLGGEALRGFSMAMLIGIVFGTYSSIYIASPVMLALSSNSEG